MMKIWNQRMKPSLLWRCCVLTLSEPHLHSDGVLVPPLHVVDVPRHAGHGVDGLLDNIVALLVGIKVLCNFL